jgi:hypothetical protein
MLILGLVFIITSFILVIFFFQFVPFNPADRLAMWLTIVPIALFFELGLFFIVKAKIKEAVRFFAIFLVWSLILLVPVPQGYEEPIYGGSWVLIFAIWILYDKYKKSRKKKRYVPE